MNKRLSVSLFLLASFVAIFSLPHLASSQAAGGCPAPLELRQTAGGPQCMMVYTNVSELPPGCTDPAQTNEQRLIYANEMRSVECQPQSGYTIALIGDILTDGSFRCGLNIGWIAIGSDASGNWVFRWNSGCGAFSSSFNQPLPEPTGGPGVRPDSVGRCDSSEALASGETVWTGTNSAGNLTPLPYKLTARDACIAYAGLKSCSLSTNNPAFDPSFNPSTCCQYGVNPDIAAGGIITGCGTNSSQIPNTNGGASTPWTGGNVGGGAAGAAGGDGVLADARNTLNDRTCLTSASCVSRRLATNPAAGAAGGQNLKPEVQNGTVTVSVPSLNVRSSPSTSGTLLRTLKLGQTFAAAGWVTGQNVEGINRWWKAIDSQFIWSGGTKEQPSGSPLALTPGDPGYTPPSTTPPAAGMAGGSTGTTGTNPQMSSTILTNVLAGKVVRVGEAWVIVITGGAPNTPVYVVGGRGGAQDNTQMGTTDASGNFILSGTFRTEDIGSWSETWKVGSVTVKSFSFVLADAYKTDLFSHSIKFAYGQKVKTVSSLNVRATATTTGALLGTQPALSTGTIVEGGTYTGVGGLGYYWWKVDYDTGPDGWSVEDYIVDSNLNIGPKTAGEFMRRR